MCILRFVTSNTGSAELLHRDIGGMASVAAEFGVRTREFEFGVACMVEAGLPVSAVVALIAPLSHTPGMRVLRLVAAVTVLGYFVFHTSRGVTAHAIGTGVGTTQRKTCFFSVVEFGSVPADRGMALLAIVTA